MKILTLLCIFALVLSASKLTKSGDFVIDDRNKLMWQDTKENVEIFLTHQGAIEYCEKLNLIAFSDWRLPSVENYKIIIDKRRVTSEIMINRAFKYVLRDDYWISDRTWLRNFGKYGYYIFIKSGAIYYQNRTYLKYVRCVRSLQ
jgi:hypothetical protein